MARKSASPANAASSDSHVKADNTVAEGSLSDEADCGEYVDKSEPEDDDDFMRSAPSATMLHSLPTQGAFESIASPPEAYLTTARDGLNLRSGPGTDFPVIRSIPLGTRVYLLKRENRWGQIDEQGDGAADGFVHLAFLDDKATANFQPGSALPADQVRAFWGSRNPRGARLYDRYGNALVDPTLLHASAVGVVQFEGQNPNFRIEMYGPGGGFRRGGTTANHTAQPSTGRGAAMDFVIIDRSTGRMLTNHPGRAHQNQGTVGQNAPFYQTYYNEVVRAGSQLYRRFAEMARFGGYFASGDNAMDTMHIDMRGLEIGTSGGNLTRGFTRPQMERWLIPENHPYS